MDFWNFAFLLFFLLLLLFYRFLGWWLVGYDWLWQWGCWNVVGLSFGCLWCAGFGRFCLDFWSVYFLYFGLLFFLWLFGFYFYYRLLLKFIRWPFVLPLLTFLRIFLGLLFIFLKIFLHLFVFIANLFLAPFMLLLQLFLHPFSFIFQHVSLLLVFLILLPP